MKKLFALLLTLWSVTAYADVTSNTYLRDDGQFHAVTNIPGIAGGGTFCVQIDASGNLSNTGAACGTGGAGIVNSVSNSDGTLTISPTTGAVVASLALGHANTWTGAQTFNNNKLIMAGATSGTTTLIATAVAGSTTATFPANTGTVAELNLAQTWTAGQTFNNNDLIMAGATSGTTTLVATAVAGTTTATFPANTGTVAELNLGQTWTATQVFPANSLTLSELAQIPANTLLGNTTGGTANVAASTLTAHIDADIGSTRGAILERGASAWGQLTPGTSGLALVSNGGGADPSYQLLNTGGIANNAVTNALLAQMPADTVKCNRTTSTANAIDCGWFIIAQTNQWTENSTPVNNTVKFGDRFYVGDGINYKQVNAGYLGTDWFATFECTLSPNGCAAYTGFSQMIVESGGDGQNTQSSGAIVTASQSKNAGTGAAILPLASFAVINNTSHATLGWGLYGECHILSGAFSGSTCIGIETDVRPVPNVSGNPDPFQQASTVGYQDACGAGITSPASSSCGAAIQILTNPNAWNGGVIIFNGSINSGSGGVINAIAMPTTYRINWFSSAGAVAGGIFTGGSGNLNFVTTTTLVVNGNQGVSCTGINAGTFTSVAGIVTHC